AINNVVWSPAFERFFITTGAVIWSSPDATEGSWVNEGAPFGSVPVITAMGIDRDGKPMCARYLNGTSWLVSRATTSSSVWTAAATRTGGAFSGWVVGGSPLLGVDFASAPWPMSVSTNGNLSGTTVTGTTFQPTGWSDIPWLGRTLFSAYNAFTIAPGATTTAVPVGIGVSASRSAVSEALEEVVSACGAGEGSGFLSTLTSDLVTFEEIPVDPLAVDVVAMHSIVYWPPHETFYALGGDNAGGPASIFALDPPAPEPAPPGDLCFWTDIVNASEVCTPRGVACIIFAAEGGEPLWTDDSGDPAAVPATMTGEYLGFHLNGYARPPRDGEVVDT